MTPQEGARIRDFIARIRVAREDAIKEETKEVDRLLRLERKRERARRYVPQCKLDEPRRERRREQWRLSKSKARTL